MILRINLSIPQLICLIRGIHIFPANSIYIVFGIENKIIALQINRFTFLLFFSLYLVSSVNAEKIIGGNKMSNTNATHLKLNGVYMFRNLASGKLCVIRKVIRTTYCRIDRNDRRILLNCTIRSLSRHHFFLHTTFYKQYAI